MKKSILALAVTGLFAATTAQSAVVYDADGVVLDLYGDLEVAYFNDTAEDSDAYIKIDDADFGFKLGHMVSDDVIVGGVLEFSGEGEDSEGVDNVQLGDAFIGVQSKKMGELTFGKQATILDDAGIGSDFAFGLNTAFEQNETSGFQVIKYKLDTGQFYGGVAYLMNTTKNADDETSGFDAKLGARFGDFDIVGFYGSFDDGSSDDATTYFVEARYQLNNLSLEATAGQSETSANVESTTFGAAATYAIDAAWTVSGGVTNTDTDGSDDVNNYYANASYGLTDYCKVYVELGGDDADDSELGYQAGMQVSF